MTCARFLLHKAIHSAFVNYLTRCLIGFFIGYSILISFPEYDLFWMLISIILVISPEENDTRKLTTERVISNFIGSLSGLAVFFIQLPYEAKITLGILLATIICKLLNLMNVVRSAVVSVLIILIQRKGDVLSPFERFSSVFIGCLIGFSVTLVITYLFRKMKNELPANKVQRK